MKRPGSWVVQLAAPGLVAAGLLAAAVGGITGQDAGQPAARIDRLLSDSYPSTEPGAAVIVSKAGATVLEKSYGLADTERKVPVTPDTVFRLASVTKAFTGTAVLMLAERGRLDLDDPVTKLLPSYPSSGKAITVRHLLSHTSGVADYLDRPDSMAWAARDYTVAALIDTFKDRPASFAPGQKTAYSNSNYILLGAILERISGLSFADVVDSTLFKPIGMTSTSCRGPWNGIARLAAAYEPARTATDQLDWSRLLVARPYTMSALYAAGGCVSSARDLARFHRALLAGELIGKELLARSFAPAALADGRPGTMSVGGWQLDQVQRRRAAMRGGALPGVCTWLLTMPDEDVSVILLSNRTPGQPRCGMLAVQIAGIASGG